MLTNFIRVLKSICWQCVDIVSGVCGGQVAHTVEVCDKSLSRVISVWYVNTYPLERDGFIQPWKKEYFYSFRNLNSNNNNNC